MRRLLISFEPSAGGLGPPPLSSRAKRPRLLVVGAVFALNAWNGDHRAGHIYALALPMARWKYVLWKMGAGTLLLLVPVAFLSVGSLVAVGSLDLAEGLRAYPLLFAQRWRL